jgi:hypothetical protein
MFYTFCRLSLGTLWTSTILVKIPSHILDFNLSSYRSTETRSSRQPIETGENHMRWKREKYRRVSEQVRMNEKGTKETRNRLSSFTERHVFDSIARAHWAQCQSVLGGGTRPPSCSQSASSTDSSQPWLHSVCSRSGGSVTRREHQDAVWPGKPIGWRTSVARLVQRCPSRWSACPVVMLA